jgi:hypothetical protein
MKNSHEVIEHMRDSLKLNVFGLTGRGRPN